MTQCTAHSAYQGLGFSENPTLIVNPISISRWPKTLGRNFPGMYPDQGDYTVIETNLYIDHLTCLVRGENVHMFWMMVTPQVGYCNPPARR